MDEACEEMTGSDFGPEIGPKIALRDRAETERAEGGPKVRRSP